MRVATLRIYSARGLARPLVTTVAWQTTARALINALARAVAGIWIGLGVVGDTTRRNTLRTYRVRLTSVDTVALAGVAAG